MHDGLLPSVFSLQFPACHLPNASLNKRPVIIYPRIIKDLAKAFQLCFTQLTLWQDAVMPAKFLRGGIKPDESDTVNNIKFGIGNFSCRIPP